MAEYELSDIQWREKLGRRRYKVLRDKATEPPFTGELLDNKKKGVYRCAGCGKELFTSDTKYDSGSGWPSFYSPIDGEAVEEEEDTELGMRRTEILCSRCGGHL
ncbi:MAG: peptide-methionine (R)-S-oxide reductase MsrB, partial [Candidatus Thermoplasmatota archaeon]|nr:peptide-methionine (R)-S-oxide reductase MsrB [Candidatus Thermoplasmatota archaeon]